MNKWIVGSAAPLVALCLYFWVNSIESQEPMCVFKTIMGEQPINASGIKVSSPILTQSLQSAEQYLLKHQNTDGGWSCGTESSKGNSYFNKITFNKDQSDGATTAAVVGAFRKLGYRYGQDSKIFDRGVDYLVDMISTYQSSLSNKTTQIQRKLGSNIDLVMATNVLLEVQNDIDDSHQLSKKLAQVLPNAIARLDGQMEGGKLKGGTWAGVLQSSYAYNALTQAQKYGYEVDVTTLESARQYQTSNYTLESDEVNVADGAGILLYAVSGTLQSAGDDALLANQLLAKAKASGKIKESEVTIENLIRSGMSESEAVRVNTNVKIYEATKRKSLQSNIISGFGNDGGEEYLSFLQTAETLKDNNDKDWSNWFNKISNRLISTQHKDGYWEGHHCITSPVFCTATCVSILAVGATFN